MASDYKSAEDRALEKFADMMVEKIQEMKESNWQKPWFTDGAKWPRNLSGREYNGSNALVLLLHCQKNGYQVPIFATFNRVMGLNFDANKQPLRDKDGKKLPIVTVNKGEKSMPIFLTSHTCVDKETKEKIPYDDYKKLSAEEKKRYVVYPKTNVYNVFNVAAQTNLAEARPEMYAKLIEGNKSAREANLGEGQTFLPLDAMINHDLWVCPIKPTYGDEAYYSISKNLIVIPLASQFKDYQSFCNNVFHEQIHSTGAASRLNRFKDGTSFGSASYGAEELRAELGAALTSSRYGMTKHIKTDSVAYIKSWLDHLQEDPKFLKTVLNDVKKATGMLTYQIDRVQDRLQAMQDAGIEYKAGGEIDATKAADREQTLPFDPRDPLSDLRPSADAVDPILNPQLAETPFKSSTKEEVTAAKSTLHR
ncbi:MAG: ssDNA-binding domain-containing protein [Bacteroidales bacterium]|nr:ssDNA-binding domain-containing protein [Bacteroidales bacterium]